MYVHHLHDCETNFNPLGTELASDDDSKLTPLHLSARYLPRYQDEDAQTQDQEEVEVTALSSSKQAMKFLVTFCRVDVSLYSVELLTDRLQHVPLQQVDCS